jgi:hypothetical protein
LKVTSIITGEYEAPGTGPEKSAPCPAAGGAAAGVVISFRFFTTVSFFVFFSEIMVVLCKSAGGASVKMPGGTGYALSSCRSGEVSRVFIFRILVNPSLR